MSSGHGAGVGPWEYTRVANLTSEAIVPLQPGTLFGIELYAGILGNGGFRWQIWS